MSTENKLSEIEDIKVASRGLRGTLAESLTDNFTGAIRSDDTALVKFHGMYMQDDRDVRARRAEKKLDKLISFMIRLRLPGGKISAEQWLNLNDITENYGTGVIKITTRQTIQLHGLLKHELKDTIQGLFRTKLDSIDACGDVNRNVTCTSHADVSPLFKEIHAYADKISQHLLPKTNSYYEIWLDDEKVYDKIAEEDPLYQDRYLPRKFKIGIAIPPDNDVDVFINDLAMIAIIENDKLKGFNLAVGGGLSSTHGNSETYARLATLLGFLDSEEKVMKAVYEVITIQRDFGNRADRKLARMKYTIDNMGIENFIAELEKRTGFPLLPVQEFEFTNRSDKFGWVKNSEGKNFYTLFVENGVVKPYQKAFLKEVAQLNISDFRFSCNQNLILGTIDDSDKKKVENLIEKYAIEKINSVLRQNSMACVALPTCPLALAESQRYLPELITKIEVLVNKYQLEQDEIITRMTGCPNGCGKSTASEIGFIGTGPGHYNLMIGGDRLGHRLNTLYKNNIDETEILENLDFLFNDFKTFKNNDETFGDFCQRKHLNN